MLKTFKPAEGSTGALGALGATGTAPDIIVSSTPPAAQKMQNGSAKPAEVKVDDKKKDSNKNKG